MWSFQPRPFGSYSLRSSKYLSHIVFASKSHSIHLRLCLENFNRNSFLWHLCVIYPVKSTCLKWIISLRLPC